MCFYCCLVAPETEDVDGSSAVTSTVTDAAIERKGWRMVGFIDGNV